MVAAAVQWPALRILFETTSAPLATIADACGKTVAAVERRAAGEGWSRFVAPKADDDERLAKLTNKLITEVEALGLGKTRRKDGLDKARIEAISALTRTLEKIGDITRGRDRAKENLERDEDTAKALRRIDERIIELARTYAAELGGAEPGVQAAGERPG